MPMNNDVMGVFIKFGESIQTSFTGLKSPGRIWETAFNGSSRVAKPETGKKYPYQKVEEEKPKKEPERPVFNRYRALIDKNE